MENVKAPIADGLVKIDHGDDLLFQDTHLVPNGGFGFWSSVLPDGSYNCAVRVGREHPRANHLPLRDGFSGWISEAMLSGRYVEVVARPHPEEIRREFLSTEWREPKLHLYLSVDFMGTLLGLEETDLES
jgi:hypothetical protein